MKFGVLSNFGFFVILCALWKGLKNKNKDA